MASYYWVSWYTTNPDPVANVYVTGYTFDDPVRYTMVAAISADSESDAWNYVREIYPDAEDRFIDHYDKFVASDRFPGMQIIAIRKATA